MTPEYRQKLEAAARSRLELDPHAFMYLRCDTVLELLAAADPDPQTCLPLEVEA